MSVTWRSLVSVGKRWAPELFPVLLPGITCCCIRLVVALPGCKFFLKLFVRIVLYAVYSSTWNIKWYLLTFSCRSSYIFWSFVQSGRLLLNCGTIWMMLLLHIIDTSSLSMCIISLKKKDQEKYWKFE